MNNNGNEDTRGEWDDEVTILQTEECQYDGSLQQAVDDYQSTEMQAIINNQ